MTSTPAFKNRTSFAWNILKIILALGLILFVFTRTNFSDLSSTLKNGSVFWLIISAALFVSLTLLKALQYYVLMRNELTYAQVLNVIIWQNAVSNFFLAGAGILTYITTTRMEHEVKVSRSITIFLLTKAGDLTAIWVALLISSSLVWSQIGALHVPLLVLLVSIGIGIACFFFTVLLRQKFVSILNRTLSWIGLSKIKLVQRGISYLQGLADMNQSKVLRLFGLLLLYSFIYLAITILWIYTNLAIFHLLPDIFAVMFVSVLIQLVSYFPVSVFGGLGINETSSLYFWSFFDLSQDALAPALIGIRIVFYLFNLIPLIYLPVYSVFLKPHEQT
jgi:lysylphosphatidylglycerol synthase-like protein